MTFVSQPVSLESNGVSLFFDVRAALAASSQRKVFSGLSFWICPSVKLQKDIPPKVEFENIITYGGGTILRRKPALQPSAECILLGNAKDAAEFRCVLLFRCILNPLIVNCSLVYLFLTIQ